MFVYLDKDRRMCNLWNTVYCDKERRRATSVRATAKSDSCLECESRWNLSTDWTEPAVLDLFLHTLLPQRFYYLTCWISNVLDCMTVLIQEDRGSFVRDSCWVWVKRTDPWVYYATRAMSQSPSSCQQRSSRIQDCETGEITAKILLVCNAMNQAISEEDI